MPYRDTVQEFAADLDDAAKALDLSMETIVRKVTLDLLAGIVLRTPVDTGAAAGNWTPTRGTPAPETETGFEGSRGEAEARAMGLFARVTFDPPYDTWWIANYLPYIEVLEYGGYPGDGEKTTGGYSLQAPQGMVRITLAEVEAELETAIESALRAQGLA